MSYVKSFEYHDRQQGFDNSVSGTRKEPGGALGVQTASRRNDHPGLLTGISNKSSPRKRIMDFTDFRCFISTLVQRVKREGEAEVFLQLETFLNSFSFLRASSLTPEEDVLNIRIFREMLGEYIYQSHLAKYCLEKPRGYPGDFRTQEMIWLNVTSPDEQHDPDESALGRQISRFIYMTDNPKANVARIHSLRYKLEKYQFQSVASIGCGSGIEYWSGISGYRNRDIYLLDQDMGALARAKEKLAPLGYRRVGYINQDVVRFVLHNKRNPIMPKVDFAYSVGLFDYFTVASGKRLLQSLWRMVAPGGRLLVTNAHPGTSTRFWSEYIGDWFLRYKSEDEMLQMTEGLKEVAEVDLQIDALGCYQYLELKKQGGATGMASRLDS